MIKKKMTVEDHREMGLALARTRDDLVRRLTKVANRYPKNSVQARELRKAFQAIDKARDVLDNSFAREFPDEFSIFAYYPNAEDRP